MLLCAQPLWWNPSRRWQISLSILYIPAGILVLASPFLTDTPVSLLVRGAPMHRPAGLAASWWRGACLKAASSPEGPGDGQQLLTGPAARLPTTLQMRGKPDKALKALQ